MKGILLMMVFTTLPSLAFSQSDCEKFKTGKFQNVENGVIKSSIERNDSIQVEQHGEIQIKLKVEWMDSCAYRLIFLEGNDAWWKARDRKKPTPDLLVKIIEVDGDSFIQEAIFVGVDDFKYRSTMQKIE